MPYSEKTGLQIGSWLPFLRVAIIGLFLDKGWTIGLGRTTTLVDLEVLLTDSLVRLEDFINLDKMGKTDSKDSYIPPSCHGGIH